MDKCLVYGCPSDLSSSNSSVQFYYFPKHPVIAQQWLNACCVWNSDEIDLDTARICSVHFDNDSYTMVDCEGYTRILKYDALPTLFLPEQTIVYRIANVNDNFSEQNYEVSSVIIQNVQHQQQHEQIEDAGTKYEKLQTMSLESDNCSVKIEDNVVEDKYQSPLSYKQLHDIQMKNDKMKKEVQKLEQSVKSLKLKLNGKIDEYKKQDLEYNKIRKTFSSLQTKSMTLSEQKNLLSKVFSETQIKILSGKKKIYWTHDDMAIGYTIRHMSSKRCYGYLSKRLNIPLPGLSSIRRWQSMKKNALMKEEKIKMVKDEKDDDSDEVM